MADNVAEQALAATSYIDDDGSSGVLGFRLPASPFLDATSVDAFIAQGRSWETIVRKSGALAQQGASPEAIRAAYDDELLIDLAKQQARFDVAVRHERIAGIPVTVFDPAVPRSQAILLNVHGGGFICGRGIGAAIESIPICAAAATRVISVEYRLYPEYSPMEALADIMAVYAYLVQTLPAERVGIFGSSAGALLTAQLTSALIERHRPLPGGIALLAMGASWISGDSATIFSTVERVAGLSAQLPAYLAAADSGDATIFPARHRDRLAQFPPTLLISSTRDVALSSVVDTHAKLVEAGAAADLHIWEGLRHCFYYDPDFSASNEVYRVVDRFFGRTTNT
jgi:epsilon-lactone hydrolase